MSGLKQEKESHHAAPETEILAKDVFIERDDADFFYRTLSWQVRPFIIDSLNESHIAPSLLLYS